MSGTGKEYLGSRRQENEVSTDKLKAFVDCPLTSAEVSVATTATTKAIQVPAGAYVYRVAATSVGSGFTGAVVDIGDGTDTDGFMDGLTTIVAGDIVVAPIPGGAAATDETAGKYYSATDTIDVIVSTASPTGGSLVLYVWYFMP